MSLRIGHVRPCRRNVQLLEEHALDHVDDEGADGDAPDVAHAAQDDHGQDRERDREAELVGADEVSLAAVKTPARPAVEAPSANASSFVVTVLMPLLAAASSSSRIAIQARPAANPAAGRSKIIDTAGSRPS